MLALWKWYELLVLYYYSSYSDTLIGVLDVKKFEDTKDVIRSRISKNRQIQWQKEKGQTMIYKTLHRKLRIEQHEPQYKAGVNSGVPEGLAI